MKMFRRSIVIAGLIGGMALTALPAHAQKTCFTRDQAIENLKTSFGEEVKARGLSNNGKVMVELLTSEDGSWTLLMTHADGKTCLVSSGNSWTAITTVKAKGPAV
jgi:hypothetical protein